MTTTTDRAAIAFERALNEFEDMTDRIDANYHIGRKRELARFLALQFPLDIPAQLISEREEEG